MSGALPRGVLPRCWDEPQAIEKRPITIGREATGYPTGRRFSLVQARGHWNCCDVWVNLPVSWADVVFGLYAKNGASIVTVDVRSAADLEQPTRFPNGAISGLLMRAHGLPADGFELFCWPLVAPGDPLENGHVILECYGRESAVPGAGRDARAAVNLNGHPHQTWQFSTGNVAMAVGAPVQIAAAHDLLGRVYVERLTISSQDLNPRRVLFARASGPIELLVTPSTGGTAAVSWPGRPFRTLPGENVTAQVLDGGAAVFVSGGGYYE